MFQTTNQVSGICSNFDVQPVRYQASNLDDLQ